MLQFFQKFYPKTVYDESQELDENELKNVIEKAIVSDAITIYNLLSKKGIGNLKNIIFYSSYQLWILILMNFRNKFKYTTSSFRISMF